MREELKKRVGLRGKFSCTVQRFGMRTSAGYVKKTMLAVNVCDESGNQVTDHLWFTVGKQIEDLDLEPGDQIEFMATVRPYRKGYRGERDDYDDRPEPSIDYGLKFPRDFKRIGQLHPDTVGLPLFQGVDVVDEVDASGLQASGGQE